MSAEDKIVCSRLQLEFLSKSLTAAADGNAIEIDSEFLLGLSVTLEVMAKTLREAEKALDAEAGEILRALDLKGKGVGHANH